MKACQPQRWWPWCKPARRRPAPGGLNLLMRRCCSHVWHPQLWHSACVSNRFEVLLLTWSYETSPIYHVVEYFAGAGKVSAEFRKAGWNVASYDNQYDDKGMEFLQPGGFALLGSLVFSCALTRLALLLASSTVLMGLHIYAPDCSSWTRISRGTSCRNALNAFGRTAIPWVRNGNMMVAR